MITSPNIVVWKTVSTIVSFLNENPLSTELYKQPSLDILSPLNYYQVASLAYSAPEGTKEGLAFLNARRLVCNYTKNPLLLLKLVWFLWQKAMDRFKGAVIKLLVDRTSISAGRLRELATCNCTYWTTRFYLEWNCFGNCC